MDNRFNDLSSKEWLPFQKSFTRFETMEALVWSNLRFFTKPSSSSEPAIAAWGNAEFMDIAKSCAEDLNIRYDVEEQEFSFLACDLTGNESEPESIQACMDWISSSGPRLGHQKFLWVLVSNALLDQSGLPLAWTISNVLSGFLTRKDEKIICLPGGRTWTALYFRRDEQSQMTEPRLEAAGLRRWKNNTLPGWFIIKPRPRSKEEILHPAKYPEELVRLYLDHFSREGDLVFDPMSGTGSTQVAALKLKRMTYGVELSPLFHQIAQERCRENLGPGGKFKLIQGDARKIESMKFPTMDYVITSPPYWDMLNMKGAEIQAARRQKGLKTNYSDNKNDLGNETDYDTFLNLLFEVYQQTANLLKSGGCLTIVVKNVKKKGLHYPLAFDLGEKLTASGMKMVHLGFWCQDDLRIAPYGYRYTWVSNTFHHYCLTFQKP